MRTYLKIGRKTVFYGTWWTTARIYSQLFFKLASVAKVFLGSRAPYPGVLTGCLKKICCRI